MSCAACNICNFNNPKCCVTAAIIQDGKLLILKRNEEPFRGFWDLPGGYVSNMETLEFALKRELQEELGVSSDLTFIMSLPGSGEFQGHSYAVMSFFYLADISNQKIKLNKENSEYQWVPLKDILWQEIAFDSNRDFAHYLKNKFAYKFDEIKTLVQQLDSNATVNEQSFYKAMLNGYLAERYDEEGKLVGMGWIFKRQTMLRNQAVIEDMIVDESQRGKGIGRSILQQLINWAKKEKVDVIELTTNPKRVAAHKLYESEGFILHPTDHMLLKL